MIISFPKIIGASLLGLALAGVAHAQVIQDPTELSVIVTPRNPSSFTNTTIKLENYAINLDAAEIQWFVNGKSIERGVGKKEFTVRTGALGVATVVRVVIRPIEGGIIEETITLNPADIDLLWQADTYTPMFYKGKALPSSESLITVLANPSIKSRGVTLSPKNLIYRWKINDKAILAQSGYGKNTLVFQKELLNDTSRVEVEVSTPDGTIATEKSLNFTDIAPEIHFYEEDPLSGTNYAFALDGGVRLAASEGTVRAEPYFVSGRSFAPALFKRSWTINNAPVDVDAKNPLILTVRSERNTGGVAAIGFSLEHVSKMLQVAAKSFTIRLER